MKRSLVRTVAAFGLSCVFGALATGCATTGSATGSVDTAIASKLPSYAGPQARIRLADFKFDSGSSSQTLRVEGPDGSQTISFSTETQAQMAGGLKELLKLALLNTNRFQVLGREESFSTMKSEHSEGEDGWIEEGQEIKKGKVVGPDLVINASITKWAPDAGGRNVGLGGIAPGILGGLSVGGKKSEVGLILEVYDIRTQVLLASIPAKGVATKRTFGLGGLGWGSGGALGGVFSQYANTPMEDAIAQAVVAAADELALRVPQKYFSHS